MAETQQFIGVGAPLVDMLAHVEESFIASVPGEKGGMALVDAAGMGELVGQLAEPARMMPGGSAANTIQGLGKLGARCTFLGKLGQDESASYFRQAFAESGVDLSRLKTDPDQETGRCLSLITPDSERTCRTHLGAAMGLTPGDVQTDDFRGCANAHVEGYLLFNRELTQRVLDCALEAACCVSLDLASFEVVEANRELLPELLDKYVDVVFANETEAETFCGSADPEAGVAALSRHCRAGAVKIGPQGAYLWRDGEREFVPARQVTAVDTTGAGDLWAAGFLHGHVRGCELAACGRFGALTGAEVVQLVGATIPEAKWLAIRAEIQALAGNA